ncbi:MAG: hypothetical protein J5606_06425 [Bacteroidales bacterium]|nr:hypothetical protein [Bacteroidales bacterium]
MKKLLNKLGVLSMGMAVSFIMFSCSASMDSLLDDLEKASNKGNVEQLNKITEKIAARTDELTDEQAKRFYDIYDDYDKDNWDIPKEFKALRKILSAEKEKDEFERELEEGLIEPAEAEDEEMVEVADEDDLDDLNDAIEEVGKAYESAAKEVGKAYEKAGKEYETALKESQKEYDKAMQDAQNAMKGLY